MKVYCNCCGKEIRMEENMRYALEDYIVIEKIWGYFSKKDGKKTESKYLRILLRCLDRDFCQTAGGIG